MKTIEIEAKLRLADPAAMEQKLRELGAAHVSRLAETNTFFDTAEGRLKSTDQGLRVRVETDQAGAKRCIITHKGPRAHGDIKSRSETEVVVDDARHAAELLDALGFQQGISFEKNRSRWKLDGCTVELDSVPYLGDFIEIEGPTEAAVLATRDALGLSDAAMIRSSYIAMLLAYLRENKLTSTHITFKDAAPVSA